MQLNWLKGTKFYRGLCSLYSPIIFLMLLSFFVSPPAQILLVIILGLICINFIYTSSLYRGKVFDWRNEAEDNFLHASHLRASSHIYRTYWLPMCSNCKRLISIDDLKKSEYKGKRAPKCPSCKSNKTEE